MAKKCQIEKNKRRIQLVEKYAARRAECRKILKSATASMDEKRFAQAELHAMPLNSCPVRVKNRCSFTGRSRGHLAKFGVSRIVFRQLAHEGKIPGVRKASW